MCPAVDPTKCAVALAQNDVLRCLATAAERERYMHMIAVIYVYMIVVAYVYMIVVKNGAAE